jgi:cytochrome c oxidase subunit 2
MKKLLALLPLFSFATASAGDWGLPEQASTFAADVDWMMAFINWLCVFFFVLIMALMGYFMWKYRGTPDKPAEESTDHNTPLELTWTLIPLGLVVFIFYWGFQGYMNIMIPPTEAYEVQITGQKWSWSFSYPNGHTDNELHAPAGQKVRLLMTSVDVLHSFYIPAFRTKHDLVPGRYTKLWFQSDKPGTYQVFCTEYCGRDHSNMLTKAVIHEPGGFEKWLADASNVHGKGDPPAKVGQILAKKRGCFQCHSIDGTPGIGPTWKGAWGRQEALQGGGTATVDENYIKQSIIEPQAQIVAGFAPVMPTYKTQFKDLRDFTAIAKYIESLK